MKRPFWLPENARLVRDNESSHEVVSYLAPNGKVRRYLASQSEMDFYEDLFKNMDLED